MQLHPFERVTSEKEWITPGCLSSLRCGDMGVIDHGGSPISAGPWHGQRPTSNRVLCKTVRPTSTPTKRQFRFVCKTPQCDSEFCAKLRPRSDFKCCVKLHQKDNSELCAKLSPNGNSQLFVQNSTKYDHV